MRRFAMALVLGSCLATGTGCFIPAYSGDPVTRTEELIYTSEGYRHILEEWRRIWFLDQPDHLTPFRTHGGII
ncbi:MAG: hypothetical protein K8T91_16320 [Planctomycetes bacterium]|nr:hypothetical protein [Planctomycetota bacterium]